MAIYRDNSKRSQPLSAAGKKEDEKAAAARGAPKSPQPRRSRQRRPQQQELFDRTKRRKLPSERNSITHKFSIGGHEGYLTVGKYEDGTPGEIFIKMAKEGSTLSGIMDAFALSVSIALQYGVPLRALVDKFVNSRFEPSGYTGNPKIRYAKSVVDYIGRWLGGKFISPDYLDGEATASHGGSRSRSGARSCGEAVSSCSAMAQGLRNPKRPRGRAPPSTTRPTAPNAACS